MFMEMFYTSIAKFTDPDLPVPIDFDTSVNICCLSQAHPAIVGCSMALWYFSWTIIISTSLDTFFFQFSRAKSYQDWK